MDWLRILGTLTPAQRVALDLPRAWLRFRSEGGADDADQFRAWLVARHPAQFAGATSAVAAPASEPTHPQPDAAAHTVISDDAERTITLAPTSAPARIGPNLRPAALPSLPPLADRPEPTIASTRSEPAFETIRMPAAERAAHPAATTTEPTFAPVPAPTLEPPHPNDASARNVAPDKVGPDAAKTLAGAATPAVPNSLIAVARAEDTIALGRTDNAAPSDLSMRDAQAYDTIARDDRAAAAGHTQSDETIAMPGRADTHDGIAPDTIPAHDTIALAKPPGGAARGAVAASPIDPVEVSIVLPARFALAAGDANRTIPDHEAPTMRSPRREGDEPDTPPDVDTAAPPRFHYEIVGTAGEGGMGTVLIAKDTELLRRVALKQLNSRVDGLVSARTRFLREAQITAQLDHPNIVPVHTLEVAPGGSPAYTMKLVDGRDFNALLDAARTAFDGGRPDETIALAARIEHFLKVCDAIAYAHDKGVIHRDLKPANLMLGRHNEVYVMDWGLCRRLHAGDDVPPDASQVASSADVSGGASDTQLGDIVGTPKYMSPEQAQGRNIELDTRSDQCALGLILYELATLSPPYDGKTAYEVLANAAAGRRRPLVHAFLGKRGVPRDLGAIIDRATARMPAQRYASVSELAADVRRYLRGDPVVAHRDTLWQRTQRAIGRHRQRVLTGILALIALAAIAIGGLLWQNQRVFTAERLREQHLLQLRDAVADISSDVQVRMVQLESAIENLSDSVAQIADFGQPGDTRFYTQADFRDPARAPADLVESKTFGGRISLSTPVWTLPSGGDQAELLPAIRRLAALQPFHRDIYHRAAVMIHNKSVDIYAPAAESGGDDADGNPLEAIALGLSNGVCSRYPGWDGLPENYDPRQQRWYQVAEGRHSPQWGEPYRSATTHRTELSISVPMYANDQRFLGVAGALLDPDLMVKSLLEVKGIVGIRDVVLIDAGGRILASLNHTLNPVTDGDPVVAVFPVPELLTRQKLHETGILETRLHGVPVVLAFDEVAPFGWNVVAIADPAMLVATEAATTR